MAATAAARLQSSYDWVSSGFLFLDAYPNQYVARRLREGQSIKIDGNLNESVWEEVPFTDTPFKDFEVSQNAGCYDLAPSFADPELRKSKYPTLEVPDSKHPLPLMLETCRQILGTYGCMWPGP